MKYLNTSHWINFLSHPLFLAIPLAVFVITLLPEHFDKYKIELILDEHSHKANSIEEYIDLDGDGYSERIVLFKNAIDRPALKVLDNGGLTVEQWNFNGRYPPRSRYHHFGDLDNDGIMEIYLFTILSDSLILQGVDPYDGKSHFLTDRFITRISSAKDTIHAYVDFGLIDDLDSDGLKELVFVVESGFSLQPRAVYSYNLITDSLNSSQSFGVNFSNMVINDMDDDGKKEIYCSCNTLGNIHDSLNIPYDDYSSYVMGFDHHLKLLFPPLEYNVYPSYSSITPITFSGTKFLAFYFRNKSIQEIASEIGLLNKNGEVIKKRSFSKQDPDLANQHIIRTLSLKNGEKNLVLYGHSGIVFLNEELSIVDRIQLEGASEMILQDDLNRDGRREFVFNSGYSKILIVQEDFSNPFIIDTFYDQFSEVPLCISVRKNGDNLPELFVKSNNKAYFYTLSNNSLHYFKYPFWLCIYSLIAFLIGFIQYLQRMRMSRIVKLEESLTSLQLKNIKNQVDPHFTLNAINTISGMAVKGEKDKLMRFSSQYASMMRKLLNNSDKIQTTLKEELEFNILYLELQKARYNDAFDFQIVTGQDVNQNVLMPRTILHTYVENAVKHGVAMLETGGMISINVRKEKGAIILDIKDNGHGRKSKSGSAIDVNTGKGLEIIENIISLYEKLYKVVIKTEITDLYDLNGNPAGTHVKIRIPEKK